MEESRLNYYRLQRYFRSELPSSFLLRP